MVVRIFTVAADHGERITDVLNQRKSQHPTAVIEKPVRSFQLAEKLKNIQNGDTVGLVLKGTSGMDSTAIRVAGALADDNGIRNELIRSKGVFLACDKPNDVSYEANFGEPGSMFVTKANLLNPLDLSNVEQLKRIPQGLTENRSIFDLAQQMLIYETGLHDKQTLREKMFGFMDRLISFDQAA